MKRFVTLCAAIGAGFVMTSFVLASEPQLAPPTGPATSDVQPARKSRMTSYFEETAAPKHEDANVAPASAEEKANCGCESKSCSSEAASCGDEAPSCGSDANGCGSECGSGSKYCMCENWGTLCCIDNSWPFCCCCKPGDPCTLQKHLTPCCTDVTYGGWIATGFYTNNDPLSVTNNDLLSFWDRPNELNLDQAWFYIEKLAKSNGCDWACGYRADLLYGVDAQKTQAFGNSGFPNPQGWDNSWDNGAYGWAMPQLYAQVAKGDFEAKIGHFFTPIGYEVIPATGNFFYSHSFTMFNSEPFTHTGVLSTYKANDNTTYYLGWTLGWDTGYDQFNDGNNFLGGVGTQLNDSTKVTYICTAGDLGWRGESGYSHSLVFDFALSSKWEYVLQSDLLDADQNANASTTDALSYGVNNYLFYTINDCWKWGTRAEWWKSNQVTGETSSYFEVTTGLNYKASANLVLRPEVKFNWTPSEDSYQATTGGDFNDVLFGMDAIYTF